MTMLDIEQWQTSEPEQLHRSTKAHHANKRQTNLRVKAVPVSFTSPTISLRSKQPTHQQNSMPNSNYYVEYSKGSQLGCNTILLTLDALEETDHSYHRKPTSKTFSNPTLSSYCNTKKTIGARDTQLDGRNSMIKEPPSFTQQQ